MLLEEHHPLLPRLMHLPDLRLSLPSPNSKAMLRALVNNQFTLYTLLCLPLEDRPDDVHLWRRQLNILASICVADRYANRLDVIRDGKRGRVRGVSSVDESSDAVTGFFVAGTEESNVLAAPAEAT